uniref:Reverse transcriptase domain-containing protein n=1 Tax=Oryzias latipes TaxID=8090 RepID=A0A3B3IL71_ORYLA
MALVHLITEIYKAKNRKENTVGIFLDFYLTDRYQTVNYNGLESSPLPLQCGLPEGSILGLLLFLLYVNDLPNASVKLSKILFADDTSVFYSHKDLDTLNYVVNDELDNISTWCKANKLSLNIKKTHFLLFGLKSNASPISTEKRRSEYPSLVSHWSKSVWISMELLWIF